MSYWSQLEDASRAILRGYLHETGGNVTRAARLAGLNRTYFHRLLGELGIDRMQTPGARPRKQGTWGAACL